MPPRPLYLAYLFLKEGLHRLTGMDREASVPTTLFTGGIVASAFASIAAPILRPPRWRAPSPASGAMALAVLRYVARATGGEPLRDTPYAGAIIFAAMLRPAWQLTLPLARGAQATFAQLARAWRRVTVGVLRQRPVQS